MIMTFKTSKKTIKPTTRTRRMITAPIRASSRTQSAATVAKNDVNLAAASVAFKQSCNPLGLQTTSFLMAAIAKMIIIVTTILSFLMTTRTRVRTMLRKTAESPTRPRKK